MFEFINYRRVKTASGVTLYDGLQGVDPYAMSNDVYLKSSSSNAWTCTVQAWKWSL